jgi:hypothetical protein
MPRPDSLPPEVDAAIQEALIPWMEENVYNDKTIFDSIDDTLGIIEEAFEAGFLVALSQSSEEA